MKKRIGLYSRRCFIHGKLEEAIVFTADGKVTEVRKGRKTSPNEAVQDYGDAVIMPGVMDAHVHINEPGRANWEGFETATKAASLGGTTFLVDMPLNSSPVTTNVNSLALKLKTAANKTLVHCGFYGGVIPSNLSEIPALIEAGVLGIKAFLVHSGIDEFPNAGLDDLDKIMPLLAKADLPLLVHCEIPDGTGGFPDNSEPHRYQHYLNSRPASWEVNAIAAVIALCAKHRCRTHIVHVSASESLSLIEAAKKEGLPLTAETCAHYLYFSAEEIPDRSPIYKCAPPIRAQANNNKLKMALKTGILDFITSDHSPAPAEVKSLESGNFKTAWGGISGLQSLLPASWTALKEEFSLEEFIPLLTEKPAKFLGLFPQKGVLQEGSDADFVVWEPEISFVLKQEDLQYRHKFSPYMGKPFFGNIIATYVVGENVIHHRPNTLKKGTCTLKKSKKS